MQVMMSPTPSAMSRVDRLDVRELHRDQRGAVMIVGLGMACFLIGSLWFMIGVGNAIVFRDLMQEAADSAAFTSAVIHAKGMNFISAINMILLIIISAYILMGVINDIMFFACLAWWPSCPAFVKYHNFWTKTAKIMKYGVDVAHYVELAISYGYPWFATYKAHTVGDDYGKFSPQKREISMWAVSTSNIPGAFINGPLNKAILAISPEGKKNDPNVFIGYKGNGKGPTLCNDGSYSNSAGSGTCSGHGGVAAVQIPPPQVGTGQPVDTYTSPAKKTGLPVAAKKWKDVCKKFGATLLNSIGDLIGMKIPSAVKTILQKGIEWRYCNDMGSSSEDSLKGIYGKDSAKEFDDAMTKSNESEAEAAKKGGGTYKPPTFDNSPGKSSQIGGDGSILGKLGIDIKLGSSGGSFDPGFDKWWGKDGPLLPWAGAGNGTPWHQVWALNMNPDFIDESEHRVGIAARKFGVQSSADPMFYISQAEFYYDCTKEWMDDGCNKEDNAGYSLRWRARLVRVEFPGIINMLSSFATDFLVNMKGYQAVNKKIVGAATSKLTKMGVPSIASSAIGAVLGKFIETAQKQATGWINKQADQADDKIQSYINTYFGMYH